MTFDLASFAAARRKAQDEIIAALVPVVARWLVSHDSEHLMSVTRGLFDKVVKDDGGDPAKSTAAWAQLAHQMATSLARSKRLTTAETIATWMSSAILSTATIEGARQSGESYELEWVTMHDSKVRHTHHDAQGQRVKPGHPFRVGTSRLMYPGDTSAPIREWINCRCTLAPVPVADIGASAVDTGPHLTQGAIEMTDTTVEAPAHTETGLIPWHGVLAPEGVWSGDKRKFEIGALSHRNLPLPLTYQKTSDDGHKGSVTVGSIDYIDKSRGDNMVHAGGSFLATPEADEVVGLLAHFGKYGVSVDADDAEFELDEENEGINFTQGRISSASVVAIPAFQEAYVTLGADPSMDPDNDGDDDSTEEPLDCEKDPADPRCQGQEGYSEADIVAALAVAFEGAISEKSWDGSASRFTPEQWKASCILHTCDGMEKSCHHLPIKEPNGDLSRAGVHAAAGRINQAQGPDSAKAAARSALRGAYKTLGEDPPDSLKAADETGVALGRGPGWITDPIATERIYRYWTQPGEKGFDEVQWGVPGDFDRCRMGVGEEIGEGDPEKLRYINQICAQWHHDVTGFWPGHAPTELLALESPEGDMAPAVSLVAAAVPQPPAEWFRNPEFTEPTPVTVGDDGHVSGHLALWGVCHIGFDGVCIDLPHSETGYSDFLTGYVVTADGEIPVANISLGGGHAPGHMRSRQALAYYDSTSTIVADIACGEDDSGIWINGWVRPWIDDEKVYELRAASLSGDWRKNYRSGSMEMILAHAANAPGYAVPRVKVGTHNGEQVSLVASAAFPEPVVDEEPLGDLAEAIVAAMEDRANRRKALAEIVPVFEEA